MLFYLRGTLDVGIRFDTDKSKLFGYMDADWASNVDDRRLYTGFVFTLNEEPISWETKTQQTVALSSTEANYRAPSEASKEAIRFSEEPENG